MRALRDCLAWLEKQGGLKPLWDPVANQWNELTVLSFFFFFFKVGEHRVPILVLISQVLARSSP